MKKLYGSFQQGASPLSSSNRLFGKNALALAKHLVVLLALVLMSSGVWGQVNGDYQTRADGNWNANTTWQVRSGGAWVNCGSGDYPGATVGAGTVTILNTHDVILNVSPANNITALVLETGNRSSSITFNSNFSLNVTGNTTINIPTSTNASRYKFIKVLAGSFTTSNIIINASLDDGRDSYIEISSGSVTVSGNITMNGSVLRNYILFSGNGTLNIGGGFVTNGFMTSTTGGSTNAPTTGTVNYYKTSTQTVWQTTYNNLTLSGSGAKTTTGVTVNGIMSMEGTATATATPTYDFFATLQYKGSNAQTTGAEFPATFSGIGGVIVDNPNGVNMSGDHTIDNALTVNSGAFTIGANTLTLNGAVPACGSLIGGATSNLVIGGTAANAEVPSGSLNNLTLSRANGATLCGGLTLNGTLTLNDGLLSLSTYDLTLGTSATTAGTFSGTSMVETNGTGRFIKQGNNAAGFHMTYPVGTGSYYNGMVVSNFAATVGSPGTIAVRAVTGQAANTSATDLNKHWIVETSNLSGITTDLSFEYNDPGEVLGNAAAYDLRYSATNPATTWASPNNPSAAGVNPLTTTANSNLAGTWTAREIETQTFYSLRSGNWNDPTMWTLDPAGAIVNNPGNTYPHTSADNAVVKNGREVLMNIDNVTCKIVTVEGTLDLAASTGHAFTTLRGNGRIEMSEDNWPSSADASHFITAGQGEGTVAYYGDNLTLTNARTFYNMEVLMTAGQILTLMNDYTVSGSLEVKTGTFKINNDASTVKKTLTVVNDISVDNGAWFTVGLGDVAGTAYNDYHDVICSGNFTNNGTVQFSNLSVPTYNALATNGGVNLIMTGASNKTFTCNNTTNLYRLVVNKGTDQTYILNLDVTAYKNFRLYAANNTGSGAAKALYIQNGTLRLTGTLYIPSLTEDGADYSIPTTGCLWMDSPSVRVTTTANSNGETTIDGVTGTGVVTTVTGAQSFSIFGKFRITNGTLKTNSHGFVVWAGNDAVIQIDGGTVETPGLRSATASTGKYSYLQSGGTVKMYGDIGSDGLEDYSATFSIKGTDNVFAMSGGTLEIYDANTVTAVSKDRAFEVYADPTNCSVTGGTVRIYNSDLGGGNDFYLYSTVPFYNLELQTQTSTATNVFAESAISVSNNLSVGNYCTFDMTTANFNLSVGGNFTVGATSTSYNARANTTTFTGASNSTLTNASASAIAFNNLIISKEINTAQVGISGANSFSVAGNLTLTKGVLATTTYTPSVAGNITITDGAITNTTGYLTLNGTSTQSLSGDGLEFGSLAFNATTVGAQLSTDIKVTNLTFHSSGTAKVNIGTYNLTASGAVTNYSSGRYIYGSGDASDGGLSLYVGGNGAFTFPVGISGEYTPCAMTVSSFGDNGYVTCTPVNSELQTTNQTATVIMPYYWRMNHSGFTALPNVVYTFTYTKGDNTGYYPGKVLDVSPYTRSYVNNLSKVDEGSNTIIFDTPFALEKANYTAGEALCFTGLVRTFYTRDNGSDAASVNWNDNNTWTFAPNDIDSNGQVDDYEKHDSRQPSAGAYPVAGDVAVIGWVPWTDTNRAADQRGMPHGVNVNNRTEACAEVVFSQMKDASGNPTARRYRYNFQFRPTLCMNNGSAQLNTGMVRGEGMFWNRYSDPNFTNMDIGEFAAQDSSYILYETTGGNINNTPAVAPNLLIGTDGWGSNDQNVTLTKDVVTNGNFEILGDANIVLSTGVTGNITVGRDFNMYEYGGSGGGARLVFGIDGTSARTVTIGRDLILNNNGAQISLSSWSTTNPDWNHNLLVGRNIYQNTTTSGLDFWNADNQDLITLTLFGTENMTYTHVSGAIPDLYRLIVNKGVSTATTATFNTDFILNGPTNGSPKALELINGLLILNNSSISLALTSGGANFPIPSTAGLELTAGTYTANGTSGIDLDGLLRINGATLNMSGGDNPIVISASGNAALDVSAGTLTVGGQIRRDANTDIGILNYSQSGGTVYVGRSSASVTNRGVFEVLGAGSSLTLTGGDLYIERQSSASVPALYLTPGNVSLSLDNVIHIGGTIGSQTIGVYSTATLQNLDVLNSCTANMLTVPLTLNGNLAITSGTLNANGLALNIGGNFTKVGNFNHGSNTTTFNGSGTQTITGNTTFYNLVKSGANTLQLASPIDVDNDLSVTGGSLSDANNAITVQGDVVMNGTHQFGGSGNGITMDGTLSQSITGNGTFGALTINNPLGVSVPIGNTLTITDKLALEVGVFNIDKNLLVLQSACTIQTSGSFTSSNMIQTNASFTDSGVKKYFNSGAQSFTFPIGSGGRYTPVTMAVDALTSASGSISLKASAEDHPSVTDPLNVLKYYWIMKSSGITGFDADVTMKYEQIDVKLNGYVETDYITARLLADGSGNWNKGTGTVDASGNTLTFTFGGVGDAEISGDYTAGVNSAIPAQVPSYISVADGPWTTQATWAVYNPVDQSEGAAGVGIPVNGPRGSIVIIRDNVTSTSNDIKSYQTTIRDGGRLSVGTTLYHRLGVVSGQGTLASSLGDLPAADYISFVEADAGTLEYDGSGNISILTDFPTINNLILSGTNSRILPNINVQLLGAMLIDGPVVDNNTYDKTLSVKGDVTFNSGSFVAGNLSSAKVVLNGSTMQEINGTSSFTSSNKLYHFEINNSAGITLYQPLDVSGDFSLTSGLLYTTEANILTMTNSSAVINGGGSTSYVDGPFQRNINSGVTCTFPVGSVGRYGSLVLSDGSIGGVWKVKYVNGNPLNNSPSLDPSLMETPIQYVSHGEYWNVKAPTAATANVTVRWDANSGISSLSDLRVVQWNTPTASKWNNISIGTPTGNTSAGTVKTSSTLSFNTIPDGNFITFGTITIPAYTWLGASNDWFATANWAGGVLPSAGTNVTIDNQTNDPVISGSTLAQVNNLTMASGATLTLNPGARMTVNGNITNNPGGDIIIRNTVASPTSFMTYGTIANPVSVEWTYPTGRYFYVGHCVDGQTFANYQALADPDPYMFRYPAGAWAEITAAAYSFDTNKLEGYSVKFNGGATQLLTGALRTGSYGPMNINGWHLIGNPYSTYLDLESAGLNRGNALPTIWTTTNATGSAVYATYNINTNVGANGGTRYIAPGQAFWIRNYSASTLSINNTARTHATGVLKASSLVDDVLRVSLSKGVVTDEAVMVFRAIGSDVYSAEYDSEKRLTTGTAEMSLYMLKDNRKLIINALPEDLENRIVPLSITIGSANAGVFKLSATNLVEFMPDMNVYLLDKVTGETINLREKPEYSFTSAAVSAQNRFDLSFAPIDPVVEVPTGTITGSTDNVAITAIGLNNKAIVKVIDASFAGEVSIEVLDALGRLHERKVSSTARTEVSAPSNTQFYLVKVTYKDKVQVFKIVTKMD